MKNITALLLFIFFSGCIAYSQNAIHVSGERYEGYIFPKEFSVIGCPVESNRYTPSLEDIESAEIILRDSINSDYVKSAQRAYRKPPINKRTLKNYRRQYVGYTSENGEKLIQIYLNENKGISEEEYSRDIIMVLDGGWRHWSITINISTGELNDMRVNGEA